MLESKIFCTDCAREKVRASHFQVSSSRVGHEHMYYISLAAYLIVFRTFDLKAPILISLWCLKNRLQDTFLSGGHPLGTVIICINWLPVDTEWFYFLSERFDFLAVLGVKSEDHISFVLPLILEFMTIHLIFRSRQNCWTCDRLTSPYFKY